MSEQDQSPPANPVAARIARLPTAEGAQVLEKMPVDQAATVAEHLDPHTAGEIMAQLDPEHAASVITDMKPPEATQVLARMKRDECVDVLEQIPAALRKKLVDDLPAATAADVRQLQQYPPDSAGGIMTTQVTALLEHLTVEQAISELRRIHQELEQMFYVYVIDSQRHLRGVLSMRDLILAPPDQPIGRIMRSNVATVPATMDQEEVARLFKKFRYLAMPVVDDDRRLLGLITVDDVVNVLSEEATEDVQKMFGAGAEERLTSPWHYSFRKRVWWLQVNLGTAFISAGVIWFFEDIIALVPLLAAANTVVASMGGNAGAQSMAVAIRGLAMGEVDRKLLRHALMREALVGLLTGLVAGVTTLIVSTLFFHQHHGFALGLIVWLALMINHFFACTTGTLIPFVMQWLGFDPAQSATIFATTVTEFCGLLATLGLAQLFLHQLH